MRRLGGKNLSAIIVAVALAFIFGPAALAQPVTEVWSQTYTGEGEAVAVGVAVHNGAVYTAGRTHPVGGTDDMFILKHDMAGNPLWTPVDRMWGGSDGDAGAKIAPYGNDLYVCGTTRSYAYDPAGDREGDGITVKWSEDGDYDTTNSADGWWTRFSGDANYWGGDSTSNCAVDASGNLYVAGTSERGWGNPWAYVEQYDSAGAVQWHQHYGTSGAHHYSNYAGLALSGGNVFTTGRIDDGSGDDQLVVRKYTTGGALEWGFTWGDVATRELGSSIAVSGADVYVAGMFGATTDPNGTDLLLIKLHDDGGSASFVGSTTLTTTGNDTGTELRIVGGTLYVVGAIDIAGNSDSLLAAYDMDLAPLWDYSWGTAGSDVAFGLAVHEGVIYVAGMENGYAKAYVIAFTGAMCGDGVVGGAEEWCDDGNTDNSDGCSSTCTVEDGWDCSGEPSACTEICGDGLVVGLEACDDGYTDACGSCNADCTGVGAGSTCGDDELCPETEDCDGTDDAACPGNCAGNCKCAIPTVSAWGVVVMTMLLLAVGTVVLRRHPGAHA